LAGELRQGALAGIMADASAATARVPEAEVRRAAMYSGNLGEVARVALLERSGGLGRFQLELFSPVSPMLAQTAADVAEALAGLEGEVAFEWKMDGVRIQAHKLRSEVRLYTRGLNEVTGAAPEIVELVREFPAEALILDGEAIAFDSSGRPHPFQATMRRFGRRLDVEAVRAALPLRAFFFDCLRLEAQTLADRPSRERFEALARAVPEGSRIRQLITSSEPAARAGSRSSARTPPTSSCWPPSGGTAAAAASSRTCTSVPSTRRPASTSCSARPSRASPTRCSTGRPGSFSRARCGAIRGRCTSGPSWSSRSPSATCRRAPATPGGSR